MSSLIYKQVGRDNHYKIWHTPEQNMFILIQSGIGSVVFSDRSYPMTRGTLCFIGKQKYHYTFPDLTEQYVRSKLFISSDELEKLTKLLSSESELCSMLGENKMTMVTLGERSTKKAEEVFQELSELSPDSPCYRVKVYAAVLGLISLLSPNNIEKSPCHFDRIQAAIEYINLHITEDIVIDRICDACYMSKYHLCRLFKEKVGLTIMQYVLKTRITLAKEMLVSSDSSVMAISESCGFSSISYFSRAFKSETGMTPLQYRRMNAKINKNGSKKS